MKQLDLQLSDPPRRARTAALRSAHFRSHTPAPEAIAINASAQRQEARVVAWFRTSATRGTRWTPTQVWRALGGEEGFGPKTSLRRALTNLSKGDGAALIHHEDDRRPGPYPNAKESTWSLR